PRLETGQDLVLDVDVLQLRFAGGGAEIASRIGTAAADDQDVADLHARIEREHRVDVVVRLQGGEGAADAENRYGAQSDILLSAYAVHPMVRAPPVVAVAEQREAQDVVEVVPPLQHGRQE